MVLVIQAGLIVPKPIFKETRPITHNVPTLSILRKFFFWRCIESDRNLKGAP